jgi:YidC/Oxa1 family membrane protein insertase
MFITLPIFMVVYRVVTTVRPIKASVLFGIWNFSYSPISEITGSFTDGGWTYVFFILLVIPLQILSMKLPQMWAKRRSRSATASTSKGGKQLKKTKMIQWVFMGVMAVMVVMSATGVGVYWFFNSLFSIGQAYLMHKIILRNRRKHGTLEAKLEKLGLE